MLELALSFLFLFFIVVVTIGFINDKPTGYENDGLVTLMVGVLSGTLQHDFMVTLFSENSSVPNSATGIQ